MCEQGNPRDITSAYVQFLFQERTGAQRATLAQHATVAAPASAGANVNLIDKPGLVRWGTGEMTVESVNVRLASGEDVGDVLEYGASFEVVVRLVANAAITSEAVGVGVALRNLKGLDVITSTTYDAEALLPPLPAGGRLEVVFALDNILGPGHYAVLVNVEDRTDGQIHYYDFIENAHVVQVISQIKIFSAVLPKVVHRVKRLDQP
jgi:hypothetical protein